VREGADNLRKFDMKRKAVKIIGTTPTGFLMSSSRRLSLPLLKGRCHENVVGKVY
jgi:hypothetical protein